MSAPRNAAEAARALEAQRRWFALTPPEGVEIRFEVATLAARFGAQLLDILITVIGALALTILIALTAFQVGDAALIVFSLMTLLIRAPYYIASELFWNGQTLGKKALRLRVLSADGRGLTTQAVVIRNLLKEVEVFMPGTLLLGAGGLSPFWLVVMLIWIAIVLAVPLFNRQRLRLGDILGHTIVVQEPKPVLLPDLADQAVDQEFVFSPDQLEHYGRFELETLETFLRSHPLTMAPVEPDSAVVSIARQIIRKIGYKDPVPVHRMLAFLHAFYKAQRAFLEGRQMLGDVRDDKHHNQ
ncbi:RDD family protein [Maricaulis sp. D1M11]|uniref:RDD family protein n=1 Tax=Maricaulis sp. D1M11 TaxID=3076117 RepID=UPI0039B5D8EF